MRAGAREYMRVCESAHVYVCVRVRASVGEHACAVQSRWFTTGQFHVTTHTTHKNKSSYSEYLVIVLYSTHISCHGLKGNIQI